MHSGATWFTEDPQNQNTHPIRDILERSTSTHLYKLFQSAIMYALVVVCGVGNIYLAVRVFTPSLLLFRWKLWYGHTFLVQFERNVTCPMGEFREPLATVPCDPVFIHFVLPYTIHYSDLG